MLADSCTHLTILNNIDNKTYNELIHKCGFQKQIIIYVYMITYEGGRGKLACCKSVSHIIVNLTFLNRFHSTHSDKVLLCHNKIEMNSK